MDDFERRMDALRARFAERAVVDRAALCAAWEAGDRDALLRTAHSLAGNAGLFGHPGLSEAARLLEEALGKPAPNEQVRMRLDAVLGQLPDGSAQ